MTNLIHTCFIFQYVHYNPLHVSSTTCSSSGGWIVLMQHLVSSSQSVAVRCTGWDRTAEQFSLNLSWPESLFWQWRMHKETIQSIYEWRNLETHSFNHCCSVKAIIITYSECVFVSLGIQHEMLRMRHFVICCLYGFTIISHVISYPAWFSKEKKIYWTRIFLFSV